MVLFAVITSLSGFQDVSPHTGKHVLLIDSCLPHQSGLMTVSVYSIALTSGVISNDITRLENCPSNEIRQANGESLQQFRRLSKIWN